MSTRNVVDYSALAPKFAAACAAAVSFAIVGMLSSSPNVSLPAPRSEFIVTLPTIVVVPDATDRAAAAALSDVVAARDVRDGEGV